MKSSGHTQSPFRKTGSASVCSREALEQYFNYFSKESSCQLYTKEGTEEKESVNDIFITKAEVRLKHIQIETTTWKIAILS